MPQPAPAPRSVAVLRALWLGDLLCAVPVLRALRGAWPEAHIALVGLPWAREFAGRFHAYVDELIEMPGLPGLVEQRPDDAAVDRFLATVRRRSFDLAIQLQGDGRVSNRFVAQWGAKRAAGFHWPGYPPLDPELSVPYRHEGREVTRLLRILPPLGVPARGERLEFPVHEADRRALAAVPGAALLRGRPYAVLHPGSRGEDRRWPASEFAAVADALAGAGLQVVLTGTAGESRLAAAVARLTRLARPVDLVGRTTLGALGALVEGAGVVVCNDTGISHVADALGTASVVVSMDRETVRWAPADARLHPFVDVARGGTTADVIAAALRLLRLAETRVA